jgi:HAD superfamily hydrolase (TIGR01509 family)
MRSMTRGVIFDIDGTLIDSVDGHARAWQEVFARLGYDVPFETVRGQIGKGGDQLMPVFLPKDLIEREGEEIERQRLEIFKSKYLPHVRPFPGTRELFERLKAEGLKIVLASSAKGEELKAYKTIARIDDLVEEETSSDDVERSKPHPDIFEAALAKLGGVDPSEAVAVGDTPYDAEAAGKAGVRTVGVLCGGFPEADLRSAGCVAIYRDPADLLAHLETSPLAPGPDA